MITNKIDNVENLFKILERKDQSLRQRYNVLVCDYFQNCQKE